MICPWLVIAVLLGAATPESHRTPTKDDADLKALADRGAVVTVMTGLEGYRTRVDFPGGALRQRWRREHSFPFPLCGMGVEFELEPPADTSPMTDKDLVILERLPRLDWVDLTGTKVTPAGVNGFKKRRRKVQVVWQRPSE